LNHNRIEFKLTYGCNFKCNFCIVGDKRGNIKSLPMKELLCSLDKFISENFVETIHLSSGEPTLYKELEALLYQIRSRKILISLGKA